MRSPIGRLWFVLLGTPTVPIVGSTADKAANAPPRRDPRMGRRPGQQSSHHRSQCQQTRRRFGNHDRVLAAIALLVLALLTGCAAREDGSAPEAKAGSETAPHGEAVGQPGCQPPTPVRATATPFLETRGSGSVTAWALLWVEPPWPVAKR
jgi:hypothetical protein